MFETNVQFKNWSQNIEISPGVSFQQLHNMWMFEHVTDCGLSLEVVQGEAGRGGELGNINYFYSKFLKSETENCLVQYIQTL